MNTPSPAGAPRHYEFATPHRIIFGTGCVAQIGAVLQGLGCRRPIVITDPGIAGSGLLAATLQRLVEGGLKPLPFAAVEPEPPESVVHAATALAVENGADGVVGLGGGSSLDTAKLVALLVRTPQRMSDIYGVGKIRGSRLPLILVPTTAGTGSEATPIAIVTTPANEKQGIVGPQLLADVAIVDPDLTLTLPPKVTAATGLDAMVHAIEAFTSKRLKNAISDALAVQAVRLLYANLVKAVQCGSDRVARAAMLEGSLLAGLAFANAPVAAVHALAYPVGGRFHLPHGVSIGLMLKPVLHFNVPACGELYAQLARALIPGSEQLPTEAAAMEFVRAMGDLVVATGLPKRLREVNVPESDLPLFATEALKIERLLQNNPRDLELDDALAIYREAW